MKQKHNRITNDEGNNVKPLLQQTQCCVSVPSVDLFGDEINNKLSLADKYLMCPTTVLNTRDPKWQDLKRKWMRLGIKSELGRLDSIKNKHEKGKLNSYEYGSNFVYNTYGSDQTVSIFDPVVAEIIYKWFAKCNVLDPFAGGSVRGIVANYLGFKYTGIELRKEQVDSNREQALDILPINNQPQWYIGDSEQIVTDLIPNYDLIFSCPPYMNLEVYSDLPDDLSTMQDNEFIIKYQSIIAKSCNKLIKGGYAVFVVGDLRDKKGYQKDFTGITKQAFAKAGMKLYNELILVNSVGTKAMTLERGFKNGKLAKVHQNIYVFVKP
jgi:DNA modification methylase